jgi:hypothetical protein
LDSRVGGVRMFTPLKAQYTDRNGKIKNCIIRAFVNTDTGIKAVIEMEETHNLQEIAVHYLKITDYENLARIWSKSNE